MKHLITALAMTASFATAAQTPSDDPYLWLEEVQGEKALAWVRERNRESRAVLEKHPRFESMRARFLEILDSKEKIPTVTRRGDLFYNLWQDANNPRGLWRRTTLSEYLQYLENRGISPNVASCIGAGTIREHVIGLDDRKE